MNTGDMITTLVPALMIFLGGLAMVFCGGAIRDPKKYEFLLRGQNEIRGVQTEITQTTIQSGKNSGTVLIAVGVLMMVMSVLFVIFKPIS